MVIPPLIGNPYNGYINPCYWVDDQTLLHANNASLDPIAHMDQRLSTKKNTVFSDKKTSRQVTGIEKENPKNILGSKSGRTTLKKGAVREY